MAKSKETLQSIEKKYSLRIDRLIKRMSNATMSELWVELDKLKEKMRKDLEKAGIDLEDNRCDLDAKDESSNAGQVADNLSNRCDRV